MKIPGTKLLISTLLLGAAFGCGGSKGKKSNPVAPHGGPKPELYFVHGDPMEMLQDSTADSSGLLAVSDLQKLSEYTLYGNLEFRNRIEKAKVKEISSQEELEEANQTDGDSEAPAYEARYKFFEVADGYLLKDENPEAKDYPQLHFSVVADKIVLDSISGEAVQPVHYSMKPDAEAFSLLFKHVAGDDSMLGSIYFIKRKEQHKSPLLIDREEDFFLYGNRAIAWQRDIELSVCGSVGQNYVAQVEKAMQDWEKAGRFSSGKIGSRAYTIKRVPVSKPFSDLNQNCVHFVEHYKNEDQDDLMNMGVTIPIIDGYDQELINAQVFIFMDATKRSGQSQQSIVTHEIGHALGLGHEFPESAFDTALTSIMGYDGISFVTSADGSAISNLYSPRFETQKLVAGSRHHCALSTEGRVACWGLGELGGQASEELKPVKHPSFLGVKAVDIAAFADTSCAVTEQGAVWCWGDNSWGVVAHVGPSLKLKPTPVELMKLNAKRIFLGQGVACLANSLGQIQCWGKESPVLATDALKVLDGAKDIYPSAQRICGLMNDGNLRCVEAAGLEAKADIVGPFEGLALSPYGFCASGHAAETVCLASSPALDSFTRDNGPLNNEAFQTVKDLNGMSQLSLQNRRGCGFDKNQKVQCWGAGALGLNHPTPDALSPVEALDSYKPISMALNGLDNNFLSENKEVYGWDWIQDKLIIGPIALH